MDLHFRTDSQSPPRRFDSWRETLHDTYYRLDCKSDTPGQAFRGRLDSQLHGGIRCSRIASSPNRVSRTRAQIRAHEADELGLLVMIGGSMGVDHHERHARLQPGDLLTFDNSRDYVFDLRCDYDLLCFQLPRDLLPQHGERLEGHLGARLPGHDAAVGVLRSYATSLAQRLGEIPEPLAEDFLRHLGDLLKLACDGAAEFDKRPPAPRAATLWRVTRWIEANLESTDLCPEQIARCNGLSLRALHQLFREHGVSVMQTVLNARLARCQERLLARGSTGASVEQVAFEAGFRDPSHFRRAYRARYGIAPSRQ